MTNTKSTKRALLVSVMAMAICFTMLLGTTFAWFTDSAEVTDNVIAAGSLQVELTAEKVTLNNVEPGYVHIQKVNIKNAGTLAFNYKLVLDRTDVPVDPAKDLATVVEVYYVAGDKTGSDRATINALLTAENKLGTLKDVEDVFFKAKTLAVGANEDITLIYVVPGETVGNEYQLASAGTFTVKVLAAQLASESDSIDNQYDKDAKYENGDLAH